MLKGQEVTVILPMIISTANLKKNLLLNVGRS